jgi:hypothetical protein
VSAGSSSQYVPDLPSYGRRNDQENDQTNESINVDLMAALVAITRRMPLILHDPA